jgi:predicted negative regulator of RcsB-dependent stress response
MEKPSNTSLTRLRQFWQRNNVLIVMGSLLVAGHVGWRWIQDQEEFVPKSQKMEYPWVEIYRRYKERKES